MNLREAILATVTYADLFDYAPDAREIHRYLIGQAATLECVSAELHHLTTTGFLYEQNGAYALPARITLFAIREERSRRAVDLWREATHFSHVIYRLPFVRMVAVTGSLAANNPTADADIDYLIVTTNDRLWLCRLLVIGVVRWAEKRKNIELCPNYFVSERALFLEDQDVYTARELAQMRPTHGQKVYNRMVDANKWVEKFLPNGFVEQTATERRHRPKQWFEWLLNGSIGNRLERWERTRKIARLLPTDSNVNETRFSADYCKGHVTAHGSRTRARFENRTESIREPR